MRTSTRGVWSVSWTLSLATVFQTGVAFAEANLSSPELQTMQTMRDLAGALLSREVDEMSGEHRVDGPGAGWVLASRDSNLVRMPSKGERRSPAEVLDLPFRDRCQPNFRKIAAGALRGLGQRPLPRARDVGLMVVSFFPGRPGSRLGRRQ